MNRAAPHVQTALLALLAAFAPLWPIMAAAGALVLADAFTGIVAARKRGEPIHSAGLQRTVVKIAIYQTAIVTAHITERWLLAGVPWIGEAPVKIAAGFIGITEFKSILENLGSIQGGKVMHGIVDRFTSSNDPRKPS